MNPLLTRHGSYALVLVFGLWTSAAHAQGFIDTTNGEIEESPEARGINSDEATTQRAKEIMQRFKKGRLSSNKDRSSRFSGSLEFHDSNLDGIVDHETGDGGLEGGLRGLMKGSGKLEELAKKAREDANKKNCNGKAGGDTNSDGVLTCFNMSGVIVDKGGSHGDTKHRKYATSPEALAVIKRVAKEYGAKTLEDIQSAYRDAYGAEMPNAEKFAAIHLLRSENAWLEEQKGAIYERQWKLLRAARLAGYEDAEERVAGANAGGDKFMHDIEEMISNGASDAEVGKRIALNAEITRETMLLDGGNWISQSEFNEKYKGLDATSRQNKLTDAQNKAKQKIEKAYKDANPGSSAPSNVSYQDFVKYGSLSSDEYNKVKGSILDYHSSNPSDDLKKTFAKAADCMQANNWCHTPQSAAAAQPKNASGTTAKGPEVFEKVSGDPGAVFNDTRELIYIAMQKAQNVPVNQIEKTVTSLDFNRRTNPEYFKELDETIAEVKQLQDSDPENYNLDTMSLRELTGIRKGLNDTFDDNINEGLLDQIVGSNNGGTGSGPGASPINQGRRPTSGPITGRN